MILLIDIGNTNIYMGIYEERNCISTYRTTTDTRKSSDDYGLLIANYVKDSRLEGVIISSVVPSLTNVIKNALENKFKLKPLVVGPKLKSGMPIRMDNPLEVGSDLISVAVGASFKYGYPCLVADLGTASKIIAVDKSGAFVGGVVLPGLKIASDALTGNAAQLPEISLTVPSKVIGKNTLDAMNSGTLYGHIDSILGLVKRMEQELGYECKHVLTGGYAKIVEKHFDESFIYDDKLIFEGLLALYYKNRGTSKWKVVR